MISYRCTYPNGNVENCNTLPEPPSGAKWVYDGSAYSVEKYHLEMPPVEITFETEEGSWKYMSNCMPLPHQRPNIPFHEGEEGEWVIPRDLSFPQTIKPRYRIMNYTATFKDDSGTTVYNFNKNNPLKTIPKVASRIGYVGEWEPFNISLQNIIVNAVYVPRKIIYQYDGKVEEQLFAERDPPILEQKPGFSRRWNIPSSHANSHLVVTPEENPITYKLKFHITEYSSKTVPFNILKKQIQEPEPYKIQGSVAYWSPYDLSKPEDQECHVCYRPVIVKAHMLDGSVMEFDTSKQFELPHIDGYSWPNYTINSKDIDVYPVPKVYFALFYVNSSLHFIVPFTPTDKHFVDEMLKNNTVPTYRRQNGVWKFLKKDDDIEYYVADYSSPPPRTSIHSLSVDWSVNGLADYLNTHGTITSLDGCPVDLLETDFCKVSGINKDNLKSLESLPFLDWLKNEHIQYSDRVQGYTRPHETEKDGLIITLKGRFLVQYNEKTSDAIDYLDDYDIQFSEPFLDASFSSGKVKQLENMIQLDSDSPDDVKEALEKLYPVHTKIPPFSVSATSPYYKLKQSNDTQVMLDLSEKNINKIIATNEKVITIFNVDYHPELDIKVLDSELKTAAITKYRGVESRYEVPSTVLSEMSGGTTYTIVELGKNSFANNRSLLSITVPETVKVIAYSAFAGCHNISNIELSEGLEEIGGSAFLGCRKVQSITIPSTVKKVGTSALTSFKEVILKCPENAIAGRAIRTNCTIVKQEEKETIDAPTDMNEETNPNVSIDDSDEYLDDFGKLLKKFVKSLNEAQLEYLTAIVDGNDPKYVAKLHSIRPTKIEMDINEIYSKITDDDSDLISDGIIDDDNMDQLKEVM